MVQRDMDLEPRRAGHVGELVREELLPLFHRQEHHIVWRCPWRGSGLTAHKLEEAVGKRHLDNRAHGDIVSRAIHELQCDRITRLGVEVCCRLLGQHNAAGGALQDAELARELGRVVRREADSDSLPGCLAGVGQCRGKGAQAGVTHGAGGGEVVDARQRAGH